VVLAMTSALLFPAARAAPVSCSVMASHAPAQPLVDRVVIVGGGLGGLAAAIQLRNVGIDAQVHAALALLRFFLLLLCNCRGVCAFASRWK
jgi:hypothetical protein